MTFKLSIITFLICLGCTINSQAQELLFGKNLKFMFLEIEKGSGIYYSKYEVSVEEYQKFLAALKKEQSSHYAACNYDSTQWTSKFPLAKNKPLEEFYFNHKNYRKHPIVNIRHEGALEFCKWLTENYKTTKKYSTAVFRLPNENELRALEATVNFTYGSDKPVDYKSFPFNMRFKNDFVKDGVLNTAAITRFEQTKSGHCSVIGNVCEFTASGSSFGGSWYCYPSQASSINRYNDPDPRVGFRVIMEMK